MLWRHLHKGGDYYVVPGTEGGGRCLVVKNANAYIVPLIAERVRKEEKGKRKKIVVISGHKLLGMKFLLSIPSIFWL